MRQTDAVQDGDCEDEMSRMMKKAIQLRSRPDEAAIKKVLVECLDMHYATSIEKEGMLVIPRKELKALRDIKAIVDGQLGLEAG